jgi:6-phosphogluconolactonase
MLSRRRLILADASAATAAAAEEFTRAAAGSMGPFRVALSGGETPKALFSLLAEAKGPYRARVPWERIHFFWGDERCVPPDSPDSNYGAAREGLLSRVPVPPRNVHRIQGELPDSDAAAKLYEAELRAEFGPSPRFDWIFLGLGPDGHTASLFPGTAAVSERVRLVAPVWLEAKKSRRVTLTFPVLNAAKKVVFVVAGAGKSVAVSLALEGEASVTCPASLVAPTDGELLWILDQAAASGLSSES